jgi:tetratricopeptide (TPR) repeat protein
MSSGNIHEARSAFENATRQEPWAGYAWSGLALCLQHCDDVPGAVRAARRAVALGATDAQAHGALGSALRAAGAFPEALDAMRHALDLGLPTPFLAGARADLAACEEEARTAARMQAALDAPDAVSQEDWLEDARWAGRRRLAGLGTRLYRRALSGDSTGPWADAAVADLVAASRLAALGGTGASPDAGGLDEEARAALRASARAWLDAALTRGAGGVMRRRLARLEDDRAFQGVRGEGLQALPAEERTAWRAVWDRVAALQ